MLSYVRIDLSLLKKHREEAFGARLSDIDSTHFTMIRSLLVLAEQTSIVLVYITQVLLTLILIHAVHDAIYRRLVLLLQIGVLLDNAAAV